MYKGTVKWYDQTKGYGFVQCEDQEYFMHATSIVTDEDKLAMAKGLDVQFDTKKGKKGPQTSEVRIIQ